LKKNRQNIWWFQKKVVPLHQISKALDFSHTMVLF
jgi:hypothetical protein